MSFSPLCRHLCKHRVRRASAYESLTARESSLHSGVTPQGASSNPLVESATAPPEDMALRALIQAKVTSANTIHELDTIDCFTDDWDTGPDSKFTDPALEIHLACQHAAAECKAVVEILDSFLCNPAAGGQVGIFVEMEVRRENAADEVRALMKVIEELAKTDTDPELSLKEIGKRAQRLLGKLQGLKGQVEELEKMVQVPVAEQSAQSHLGGTVP